MKSILFILLFASSFNNTYHSVEKTYTEKKIETVIDTINYWHICINGKPILKTNHSEKNVNNKIVFLSNKIPQTIEFHYATDHGFQSEVHQIIEIQDINENVLKTLIFPPPSFKDFKAFNEIPIATFLKKEKELFIKCKFYYSIEERERAKKYVNPSYKQYSDLSKVESFLVCHLEVKDL